MRSIIVRVEPTVRQVTDVHRLASLIGPQQVP